MYCARLSRIAAVIVIAGWAYISSALDFIEGGNFHITYHEDDKETAAYSLEVLLKAQKEFEQYMPLGDVPVSVIISHTYTDFQKYTGRFSQVSVSGLAKPSQSQIIVKSPRINTGRSDYTGTLRHELVHILLYRNTDTAALPKWMNEGICMSLANEYYWTSMFTMARLYTSGRVMQYHELDKNLRQPGDEMSFGDTYAQGLSLTRYLRDELGEEKFWAVIMGVGEMPFPEALEKFGGITLDDFILAYRGSLWWTVLLGSFGSGIMFIPASILVVLAWLRMRRKNRITKNKWQQEEEDGETVLSWDDIAEGPYEWELGDDSDD